jgi:hypothetical protein
MNKVIKSEPKSEDQSKKSFWHNDGPTSDVSSLSVLLDWLTTEGNYVKGNGRFQTDHLSAKVQYS